MRMEREARGCSETVALLDVWEKEVHCAGSAAAKAARLFVIAEIEQTPRRVGAAGISGGIGGSKTFRFFRPNAGLSELPQSCRPISAGVLCGPIKSGVFRGTKCSPPRYANWRLFDES
jgi:hypothetical protein